MVRVFEGALLRALAAGAVLVLGVSQAFAHVKWFSSFDVAAQPHSLNYLELSDFRVLVVLSLLIMALGCLLEESPAGPRVMSAFDRVTGWLRADAPRLIRTGCGFFFIALWTKGGIILTPELKTSVELIPWLQLAIAIALIWRVTSPLAALGIVVLFAFGVRQYGIFHLADYPIFLGIAAYIALTGLQRDFFGIRPIDILRWSAGITLMWASVEKWAYPEWSFPLIAERPSIAFGYEAGFFMRAAGVIEFTLAFALLWTPLVRRAAAVILAGMFIGACFEFGKLDVIGHAGIIIVLLVLIGDDMRRSVTRKHLLLAPVGYAAALAGFIGLYYGMHAVIFAAPHGHSATVVEPAAPSQIVLPAMQPVAPATAVVQPAQGNAASAVPPAVQRDEAAPSAPPLARIEERPRRFSYASRVNQREPTASSLDGSHTAR